MDSLLQVHDRLVIHLNDNVYEFPLPYPFCTFDYRTFCYRLWSQTHMELLHASVLGYRGHLVYTTKGVFDAELLMDATGWRAALATNGYQRAEPHEGMSFGLETVIPLEKNGLHFYYDKQELGAYNVGWLFPMGTLSRVGLGSYRGRTRLNAPLQDFAVRYFGSSPDGIHGGYWPQHRQPATSGSVFRTGDAAGQCLPFSGEGIRPALYFGALAGNLARRVLKGEMRVPEALQAYQAADKRQLAIMHGLLLAAQHVIPGLPIGWMERIAAYFLHPERLYPVLQAYREVCGPDVLSLFWSGKPLSPASSPLAQHSDPGHLAGRVL